MKIDFSTIEESALTHFKGGEGALHARMFSDESNRILKGRLLSGHSIGMHTHETSAEIIYILSGQGKVLCDGAEERVTAGDCHYCKKGSSHSLINDSAEELTFFAVVPEQ